MAFTFAEGLVGQIKIYIEANLAAKVAALNTEYADGITLEDRRTTILGVKSLKSIAAGDYPVLYVLSLQSNFAPWTVTPGQTSGQVVETKSEIAVGIVVTEQDPETLHKRLYRYSRALVELMLDGQASAGMLGGWDMAGGQEWQIDMITDQFTGSAESSFVGETTLTMRGNKIEIR